MSTRKLPLFRRTTLAALWLPALLVGCRPGGSPPLLDRQEVLERFSWWDNRDWDWYRKHIPFFESPDPDVDATYYYRWELVTKHLTYGSPATGYTLTEFLDRPFWSGTYGAISCPLGHQAYELRWLKDPRIVEDFARYWFETPGAQPRSYSNWYGDAMWATFLVLGDTAFLRKVYPHMEAQVAGWTEERWDPEHRMYRWVGAWDGMEYNINSRLTDDAFGGGEGYRPTLNSYLYADLLALARTASLFGEAEKAREYARRARELKGRVQEELWDPSREFFFHQFARDEAGGIRAKSLTYQTGPFASNPHGRELLGYVPWQFGLPDPGYESAWRFLLDPAYFRAPYGPTGVEQGDPQFFVSPRCCWWSGNAWPYATSQTLAAMANLLNDYEQEVVTPEDYADLLRTYALSHRWQGRPYVAEAADPFTGSWEGHNTFYHSEHYFHSSFVDLVITGLVGLRPRPDDTLRIRPLVPRHWDWFALEGVSYHGHDLAVFWDREGRRYGRGPGLVVLLDGREVSRAPGLEEIRVLLPPAAPRRSGPRLHNFAVNNDGTPFPLATASSSRPTAPPFYAVDGNRWYHPSPPNRWVSDGDSVPWFQVDFGTDRLLERVQLYFLDDVDGPPLEAVGEEGASGFPLEALREGTPVRPPRRYRLEMWTETGWREIPGQRRSPARPQGRRANTVEFPRVRTSRLRVSLYPFPGSATGLTEFEAWGPGELPLAPPGIPTENWAWNPGDRPFPKVSASFSGPEEGVGLAVDGKFSFTRYGRNRWVPRGSPHREDWIELDFGEPRQVARVEVFLCGDGRSVGPPETFWLEVEGESGWEAAAPARAWPHRPTAWAVNTLEVEPLRASRLRVVFRHAPPLVTGVTELRIWPR